MSEELVHYQETINVYSGSRAVTIRSRVDPWLEQSNCTVQKIRGALGADWSDVRLFQSRHISAKLHSQQCFSLLECEQQNLWRWLDSTQSAADMWISRGVAVLALFVGTSLWSACLGYESWFSGAKDILCMGICVSRDTRNSSDAKRCYCYSR